MFTRSSLFALLFIVLNGAGAAVDAAPAPLPRAPSELAGLWRGNDAVTVYDAAIGPACRLAADPSCDVTVTISTNGQTTTLAGRIFRSGKLELTGKHADAAGNAEDVSVTNASWSKGNDGSLKIRMSVEFPPDENAVVMGALYEAELRKGNRFISCEEAEEMFISVTTMAGGGAVPAENGIELDCVSLGGYGAEAAIPAAPVVPPFAAPEARPLVKAPAPASVAGPAVTELSASPASLLAGAAVPPAVSPLLGESLPGASAVAPPKCRAAGLAAENSMEALIGCLIDESFEARTAANDRLLQLLGAAVNEVTDQSDEAPNGIDIIQHRVIREFLDASRRFLVPGADLDLVKRLQAIASSPRFASHFIDAAQALDDDSSIANAISRSVAIPWMTTSANQAALMTLLSDGETLLAGIDRLAGKAIERPFLLRLNWDFAAGAAGGPIEGPYEGRLTHLDSKQNFHIKVFHLDEDVASKVSLVYSSPMRVSIRSLISDRTVLLLVLLNRLPLRTLDGDASISIEVCAAPNYSKVPRSFRDAFTQISETLPIVVGTCTFVGIGPAKFLHVEPLSRSLLNEFIFRQ